jgi:SAM-dependent methyltransferase
MRDPITVENVRDFFPAPAAESLFASSDHPYWAIQSIGLGTAVQLLRAVPPSVHLQSALYTLRAAIDCALAGVDAPDEEALDLKSKQTLAPYVASPPEVVDAMLRLATLTKDDILYDLGCGDGRIVRQASADYGCIALGVDVDWALLRKAREATVATGLDASRVGYLELDILRCDLSHATVITCYLLTESMAQLKPKFAALKAGTRIVSHAFEIPDWTPNNVVCLPGNAPIYLYVVGVNGVLA